MQRAYIDSGILETFAMGCASEKEAEEVLYMAEQYPEIKDALRQLETDMEVIASGMAVTPPPTVWPKIKDRIEELTLRTPHEPVLYKDAPRKTKTQKNDDSQLIAIEGESTHMRIHKVWRWVFLGVFVLGKIFLGFAIYYFVQKTNAEREVEKLQIELRQLKR
ncbi:MAG: hypothetical protein EOO45_01455 [Flavobacterium sp.]|nr:MAG: hypothetical protein EOO45_01455 [Flavobacterium sp.]